VRELQPVAIERTLTCLKQYATIAREAGVDPKSAICVATSSSRDSKNGPQFFSQVEKETGFRFRVISGDDEARYTFLGALLPGFQPSETAVIDIGGGSTEFITEVSGGVSGSPSGSHSNTTIDGFSLDVGSVRFTERYLKSDPVTDEEFWACQDAIDDILEKAITWREKHSRVKNLIAVAGTATTLAAWHLELTKFDAKALDACRLTRGDVHRMVEELKWRSNSERAKLPGMSKGREDVLLAGALVLWRAMELLGFYEIQISTRGLRFGVMQLKT